LVSTGRVVLKARYSIYPIQLCCVGQTGQGYRVRAEGTLRLHTRWRAYSTQAATASSPYSSAVWGRLARAIECVPRARYGYIRGGVPTARRLPRHVPHTARLWGRPTKTLERMSGICYGYIRGGEPTVRRLSRHVPHTARLWGRPTKTLERMSGICYGYIRGGVPTARRLLQRESALHDYAHVSPPHDCVRTPYERLRMGLIECRVFDTEATAKQKNTLIE